MVRLNKLVMDGFKPVKQGRAYYFLIPKYLIKSGLISIDSKYNIDVSKIKEKECELE